MSESIVQNNVSGKKFDSAEDVSKLVESIQANEQLTTLKLEGNSYGVEAAKEIAVYLEVCHNLKHLLLNDMFTSRLKSEIPEALGFIFTSVSSSQANLVTLDLSDNAIGPVTMPALLPFLDSKSCSYLKVLRLNNCGLGIKGGNMLSTCLPNLPELEELIIGRNRLEIEGVRDISLALAKLNDLKVLELPQNGTKGDGVAALVEAIKANTGLRVINLNDNVLKNMESELAEALRELKNLEVLNFGDCLLKTKGCIEVMSAITDVCQQNGSNSIREIILNGNEIGKSAGETIINAIEAILDTRLPLDTQLKVDLSSNNLGDSLVEQLKDIFGDKVDLLLEDDDGSDVEIVDEDDNTSNDNLQNGDNTENETDVDKLKQQIEEQLKQSSSPPLARQFVQTALKGYSNGTLSDHSRAKTEAIFQVGLEHSESDFDFLNKVLVALGLLKDENQKHGKVWLPDLNGPLIALKNNIPKLNTSQKNCIKFFVNDFIDEKYSARKAELSSELWKF